jgi:polysaccharide export outer membrane protein
VPNPEDDGSVVRVDLKELQNGVFSQNASLRDGDTIFVTRAETIYVYGEVKNPNAYALPQRNTTVMQALSLAGGMTNRGRESGIKIIRIVNGRERELSAKMTDLVQPGDVVKVPERWF